MSNSVDTIVVGGSAGGFNAMREILSRLPGDLPASIVVCIHQPYNSPARTAELLNTHSELDVVTAEDGQALRHGRVYVAGPDRHVLVGSDHLHLRRGAHENNFRPAIDPLFRSAAVYRGPQAIGLILSGLLDDGAAGARALATTGGPILVQSPQTADFPDMPEAALQATPTAEAVDLAELPDRLLSLVGRPAAPSAEVPWEIGLELKIATMEDATMANEERLGELSPYNCPHCNGVLWEIADGPITRFRCHTGHAYTMQSLGAAQEYALEVGLFNALRAHKGRAELIRQMAGSVHADARTRLEDRAARLEEDAELIESIIQKRAANS